MMKGLNSRERGVFETPTSFFNLRFFNPSFPKSKCLGSLFPTNRNDSPTKMSHGFCGRSTGARFVEGFDLKTCHETSFGEYYY